MSTPATASKKNVKVIVIIAGVLIAGGIIAGIKYLLSSRAKKILDKQPDSTPGSAASKPIQATSSSIFPLKNGSPRSNLVAQLQVLLGVNADGLFGPKTAAALALKTGGKTQINSQVEYDKIISDFQNSATLTANQARGNDLIERWKANSSLQLATNTKTVFLGVSKDAYGKLTPNGKDMMIGANYKLNRTDYTPIAISTNGYLIFSINNGAAAGLYKTDVNKMTIA